MLQVDFGFPDGLHHVGMKQGIVLLANSSHFLHIQERSSFVVHVHQADQGFCFLRKQIHQIRDVYFTIGLDRHIIHLNIEFSLQILNRV